MADKNGVNYPSEMFRPEKYLFCLAYRFMYRILIFEKLEAKTGILLYY